MRKIEGESFERTEVVADGNSYQGCTFVSCSITYSGDQECKFDRCTFKSCEWIFAGAMERTIQFSG